MHSLGPYLRALGKGPFRWRRFTQRNVASQRCRFLLGGGHCHTPLIVSREQQRQLECGEQEEPPKSSVSTVVKIRFFNKLALSFFFAGISQFEIVVNISLTCFGGTHYKTNWLYNYKTYI